ncbi:Bug family tripartite tricarboxylate transporter substrate binding protein [Kerstersia gyiorum]|uniref:Bug family tripartite tricarboxylate transporter substrate binding protein n=1 Tax=Kerstersia gyiorum TaxID=206506 RepID=UPI003B439F1A
MKTRNMGWLAVAALLATQGAAYAADTAWQPSKPIEFVVSAGPGGGTDQFARVVQSIVEKHKLLNVPVIVSNKGGGAGAETFMAGRASRGDAHKLLFGNNNAWLLPMKAKVAYSMNDLTPLAVMAGDDFILWVPAASPYQTVESLLAATREKPRQLKLGGTQSKDGDHILTELINEASGGQFTYVPFKSGSEAGVQLAGSHLDANTNNPSENLGQWKAGGVRPLCVFSASPLDDQRKIAGEMSLSDIPTCASQGLPIEDYVLPRTIFAPGDVKPEVVAFYTDLLAKVKDTDEWRQYLANTAQSDLFATGADLDALIEADAAMAHRVFEKEGWLVK